MDILNTWAVPSGSWRKHGDWMRPKDSVWHSVFVLLFTCLLSSSLSLISSCSFFLWFLLGCFGVFFGLGFSEAVLLSSPSRSPTWGSCLDSACPVIGLQLWVSAACWNDYCCLCVWFGHGGLNPGLCCLPLDCIAKLYFLISKEHTDVVITLSI